MEKQYTIIIAHKNIPQLLQRCLESIPVRDDVQVIVVDDNSSPEVVDFSHFPGLEREGVEVIFTKEGKGTGYARNVGLDHAAGKWLMFVDADDYLLPEMSGIMDEEVATGADVVYFRPKAVNMEHPNVPSNRANLYNEIVDEYFRTGSEVGLRFRWFSACSKMIKRDLVERNSLRFEEIRYANDTLFSARMGCVAETIVVRDNSYYMITERGSSLMANFGSKPGELEARSGAFFRVQQLIHSCGYPIDENETFYYLRLLFVRNKTEFRHRFHDLLEMGIYSRKELIDKLFECNSPISRIKRKAYTYLLT